MILRDSFRSLIFYFTIAVFCVFLSCLSTNYDYDLFARLIVGENFIEHAVLPFKDFLSYTPTHPWYDHEWGSGVVFYAVLKFFGPAGLIYLQAILMFFTLFFVIKTQKLQKHAMPVSLGFSAIFLMLFFHLNAALIRCQLFSFMFFAMFLFFLEKHRKKGSNLIWLIPLITIIWNNLHGGVVSGMGLVFLYLVGAVAEKKSCKKYLQVLAVSIPLLIINPYGISYLAFLFSAATMNRKYITEWWWFLAPKHALYYIFPSLFVITSFLISFGHRKIDITKTLVLTITLIQGLMHVKLLSIALIAAAAFCSNDLLTLFPKKLRKSFEKSFCPAILILALLIPMFSPAVPRADFKKFPLKEVEFLANNKIKGNIVVPFALGSYVSYKLYPQNLIYMDGRYEEVYNNKEFMVLKNYELAEDNWDDIVNNYPTEILMPYKKSDIYDVLSNDVRWNKIFDGRLCGIFVKRDYPPHREVAPVNDIGYYRKNIFKRSQ